MQLSLRCSSDGLQDAKTIHSFGSLPFVKMSNIHTVKLLFLLKLKVCYCKIFLIPISLFPVVEFFMAGGKTALCEKVSERKSLLTERHKEVNDAHGSGSINVWGCFSLAGM